MRLQKRRVTIALLVLSILLIVLAILPICKKNEITVVRAEEILENEETEESEEDSSAQELVVEIENDLNSQWKIKKTRIVIL